MKRKLISTMTFAFMLSVLSAVSMTANAEESAETTEMIEISEETSAETEPETEENISETETESSEEMPEISDEIDYYLDDYYDTKGNATLIKSEKIIYDTEQMQFIAVTTKSGDVFYVLINYSAENAEDSVYFLNKVDTLDLYSLLYMTDDEKENGLDLERVQRAEQTAKDWKDSQDSVDNIAETEENSETETPEIQTNSGTNNMMMLGIGAVALIAAGIVAFLMMKKKPVQKSEPELDYDDSDEDDF